MLTSCICILKFYIDSMTDQPSNSLSTSSQSCKSQLVGVVTIIVLLYLLLTLSPPTLH